MIILKVVIALGIIFLCGYLGIRKSKKYETREHVLREAITMFYGIENEIKYMLYSLPNAIEATRQNLNTSLKDVMGSIGVELLKYNVSSATISNELERLIELTSYDKQVIFYGITNLGNSDVEGQMGVIQNTVSILESQLEEATKEKQKNSKLYKTVGIATGLMIVIIFI